MLGVAAAAFLGWGVWSAMAAGNRRPVCLVAENGQAVMAEAQLEVSPELKAMLKEGREQRSQLDAALIEQDYAVKTQQCRRPKAMRCDFYTKTVPKSGKDAVYVRLNGDGLESTVGPFQSSSELLTGAAKLVASGNCSTEGLTQQCYVTMVQNEKGKSGQAVVIGNAILESGYHSESLLTDLVGKGFCVRFDPQRALASGPDKNTRMSAVSGQEHKEAQRRLKAYFKTHPVQIPR